MPPLHILLQDIKEATKNFTTVIGEGENFLVYKGELSLSGKLTTVRIKRLLCGKHVKDFVLLRSFLSETNLEPSIYEHSNIVSLLGSCQEHNERILIYEYTEHVSLDQYLDNNTNPPLSWMQRLHICIDVARGLAHIHEHGVRHSDFKISNVVLDQNRKAMVANCGLIFPSWYSKNTEENVFSFGWMIFIVLSGRPLFCYDAARRYYKEGRLKEMIDVNLKNEEVNPDSLDRLAEIAYQCTKKAQQRPTMGLVVKRLEMLKLLQK